MRGRLDALDGDTVEVLKQRVLDSVGIAVGALGAEPVEIVHETVTAYGDEGPTSLWGREGSAPPAGAAMHNTALTRYLDYMDSFPSPGETPHPSDNVTSLIAAGEAAGASGRDLIAAVGVAYEVQGELA